MTKTNENRKPDWAQPVTKKLDLSNFFINARGECCGNLETSKSKVAVAIREERDAAARAKAEQEQREEEEREAKREEQRQLERSLREARREQEAKKQQQLEVRDLEREIKTTSRQRDEIIKSALHNAIFDGHEKRDLLRTAAFLAKQIAALREQVKVIRKGSK